MLSSLPCVGVAVFCACVSVMWPLKDLQGQFTSWVNKAGIWRWDLYSWLSKTHGCAKWFKQFVVFLFVCFCLWNLTRGIDFGSLPLNFNYRYVVLRCPGFTHSYGLPKHAHMKPFFSSILSLPTKDLELWERNRSFSLSTFSISAFFHALLCSSRFYLVLFIKVRLGDIPVASNHSVEKDHSSQTHFPP